MGSISSRLSRDIRNSFLTYYAETPINYYRFGERTITGDIRSDVYVIWEMIMASMMRNQIKTRKEFIPVIERRLSAREASLKNTLARMEDLVQKFPGWDEMRLLELHDLFQVFEVDGDGLVKVHELCTCLDNLGDLTPMAERIHYLSPFEDEEGGDLDYEEFLDVIYRLQMESDTHSLQLTFKQIEANMQFIRSMSSVQKIQTGFL